ncbi:MAG: N-acetyltransferase [Dehalococcoidia bacterium]|nr:N-acetyltransferase [Dehalococcoidia bacterium]
MVRRRRGAARADLPVAAPDVGAGTRPDRGAAAPMTATRPQIVATGRLVQLREKLIEDLAQDYEWRRDPELAAYDAALPITMSLHAFIATVADDLEAPSSLRRNFAILDRADGRHIGNVMYYGYDPTLREVELGITIGLREYWALGFGRDAVRTLLGYLFRELGLRRVYLHTLTWNHRAQASFARAGFRRVREVHRRGYDFVLMEMLADEFEAQDRERAGDEGRGAPPGR